MLHERTRRALARARDAGLHVIVVTGRMFRSVRPYVLEAGLDDPVVCYQGAVVAEPVSGRWLRHVPMPRRVALEAIAAVEQAGFHLNCYVDDELYVAQEAAGHGIRHDGALVADDRIVEARRFQVTANRLEHPPGDDDHVQPGPAPRRDRFLRTRPEHRVLADQRAVEVAGERPDLAREAVREPQLFWVRKATRSEICLSLSVELKLGMMFG